MENQDLSNLLPTKIALEFNKIKNKILIFYETEEEASNHLSALFFIANILAMISCLLMG